MGSAPGLPKRPRRPQADGRDRRQADPLAHHALLRPLRLRRLRVGARVQGRSASSATWSTTRRSPATSPSTCGRRHRRARTTASADDWTVELVDTGLRDDDRRSHQAAASRTSATTRSCSPGATASPTSTSTSCSRSTAPTASSATLTAVRPPARFGHLELDGDRGRRVLREAADRRGLDQRRVLRAASPGSSTTSTATRRSASASRSSKLAKDGQLMAYRTTASGSAWTRCATRSCSGAAVGVRPGAVEGLGLSRMRVLVTGHEGYIGTRLVPLFLGAGHEVVGLDSGLFRALRARRARRLRSLRSTATSATSTPEQLRGLRRASCTSPGSRTTRSATSIPTAPTTSTTAARSHVAEHGEGRRCAALPLLLVVQPLRRGRRRHARRDTPSSTRSRRTARRRCSPSATLPAWPTTRSARRTCATRPPTACRPDCAATSWSTTSSATRSPPARCS